MLTDGVIINGIEIPTGELHRVVFFGSQKENLIISFKAHTVVRGLQITTSQPPASTSVKMIANSQVIYETTGFNEVVFELINKENSLHEQITFTKILPSLPTQ